MSFINKEKLKAYAQKKYGEAKESYKVSKIKKEEIAEASKIAKHKTQIEEAKKYATAKVRYKYSQKTKRMKSGKGFGGFNIQTNAPADPFGFGTPKKLKVKPVIKKRKRKKKTTEKKKGRSITINI